MSGYPRTNTDGETAWACCESSIGPVCQHRQPQSGYTPCACRDCMDTTVSSDVTKPELCEACQEAGCEAYAPDSADYNALPAHMRECQRDDAYGEA